MFERIHFVEFFKKFGWDFHEIRKTGVEHYILSTGPFVIVSLFATWCNSPVSSFTIEIIDLLVAERLLIMALSTNHKLGQRDSFCSFPGWRVGSIGTSGIPSILGVTSKGTWISSIHRNSPVTYPFSHLRKAHAFWLGCLVPYTAALNQPSVREVEFWVPDNIGFSTLRHRNC